MNMDVEWQWIDERKIIQLQGLLNLLYNSTIHFIRSVPRGGGLAPPATPNAFGFGWYICGKAVNIPSDTKIYQLKWVNILCKFHWLKIALPVFFGSWYIFGKFTLFGMSIPLQSLYLRHFSAFHRSCIIKCKVSEDVWIEPKIM